jgi:hypothetical protein
MVPHADGWFLKNSDDADGSFDGVGVQYRRIVDEGWNRWCSKEE